MTACVQYPHDFAVRIIELRVPRTLSTVLRDTFCDKQRDEVLLDLRREFVEKNFPQMLADVSLQVRLRSFNAGRLLVSEHLRLPTCLRTFPPY